MNPYIKIVLENMPRILSSLDRDPLSPTYGCFDRQHWNYKIRDFSSIIMQQNCLSLALLYTNDFKGNIYYNKPLVKQWAIACLEYWKKSQLSDGSFNEYWPNEHSIPSTVFSLFAVAETYKLLNINNPSLIKAMKKSCKFLEKAPETKALNQELASLAAIYSVYTITKDPKLKTLAEKKLNYLLKHQSDDGFFPEYLGADIGYLTVSLNYLAEYYRLSKDNPALNSIKKLIDFIKYFIHPDGTLGGEYGSRNTEYFLPNGFEIVSKQIPESRAIINKLLKNLNYSVDERYSLHYVFPSFVAALHTYNKIKSLNKSIKFPYTQKFTKFFPDAGIFIYSDRINYIIMNLAKGGVMKFFHKNKILINDCGYKVKDKNKYGVTNWLGDLFFKVSESSLSVSGNFYEGKYLTPTPIKHAGLRVAATLFGRKIIPLLKKVFILSEKPLPQRFSRTFSFKDNFLIIHDIVKAKSKFDLYHTSKFSMRYVPSAKFFITNELNQKPFSNSHKNIIYYNYSYKINLKNGKLS
ncbi:hypothetical protein KY330_01935 [Candidatus Woesearchaeota archaeon]|nr:hypothetical protein [Candidatus Woesearchaeota archaeon]